MIARLAINERLILEAQKLGNHRTREEAVTFALREYIRRRRQANVVSLFGKIDYDAGFDYKSARKRKQKSRSF